MKQIYPRQQWFIDRVGIKVYRLKTSCTCESCANVYVNGLLISDRQHALYLFDVECECGYKYFDSEKERDEYQRENPEEEYEGDNEDLYSEI